jgi:hypothetical protein
MLTLYNRQGWAHSERGTLADGPVLGRKRVPRMPRDLTHRTLYDLGQVRDTRRSQSICKFGSVKGSNQPPHPIHPKGSPLEV